MQRLKYGQEIVTETHEVSADGIRELAAPGLLIRVGGSVTLLLETAREVGWILDSALDALDSSHFIVEQEQHFIENLNQLPDQPVSRPDPDRMEILLSGLLEPGRDLTPLETLVAGSEGLAAAMSSPGFGEKSVGVVFSWKTGDDDRECFVESEAELPMLILEHGSLSVSLAAMKGFYATAKWMLAAYGWVRPSFTGAPQAASWFVEELRARAMTYGHGAMPLDRLDRQNTVLTYDPQRHSMAIVYVHGLFSTDAKTFDGFRDAWSSLRIKLYTDGGLDRSCVEDVFGQVGHIGFPHDTFCGIDDSGQALADALIDRFEDAGTRLALITHSRGGLSTRRAIQHLLSRNRGWEDRIKFFATFGTPHAGADLAKLPGRYEGSYLLLMGKSDQLIALDMIFCYLKHVKRIDGIDDLQPVGNPISTFIEDLHAREQRHGALPTWAVSGKAPKVTGWGARALVARAVRAGIDAAVGAPNDVVVAKASAEDAPSPTVRTQDCDHFSYFAQHDRMTSTAVEVMRAFELESQINTCTGANAPDIEWDVDGDVSIVRVGDTDLIRH